MPLNSARRRFTLGLTLLSGLPFALELSGCTLLADRDHTGPDAPEIADEALIQGGTAWALSSGGPRGFVHVGVLKALEELGLAPQLVVGSSIGALVSALYCTGVPLTEIEREALNLNPLELIRWAPGSAERWSGAALAQWLRERLPVARIEQAPRRLAIAVYRREDRRVVAFSRGDIALAVQASCAIEDRFTPVRIRGRRYVDPDLHMPLPVRLARSLGATRVLAVDASAHEDRAPPGAERYAASDARKRALTRPDAEAADLVLHPEFGYWVSLSREFRERAILAGYRHTLAERKRLLALHAG
ncbi:MAG: patatin-like phospholipase family protein [Casimicrobiaceae bacterium]